MHAFISIFFVVIMLPPACLIITIFASAWPGRRQSDARKAKVPIACQVGLGGMKPSERKKVLKHLYRSRTSEYYAACDGNNDDVSGGAKSCGSANKENEAIGCADEKAVDVEMGDAVKEEIECCRSAECAINNIENEAIGCADEKAVDVEMGDPVKEEIVTALTNITAANSSSDDEEAGSVISNSDSEEAECCAICLVPYEPRCEVMTATKNVSCRHMFHSKCLMEWLQDNELCPYCRTPMMAPDDLLLAAKETLGERRVWKLKKEGCDDILNQ